MSIEVSIVTLDKSLFSGEADMVTLPGVEGQMGVLGGHVPLLSTLEIGEIVLHRGDDTEHVAVSGGVVEVRPDKVTVLADAAEHSDEIDIQRAEEALERARQALEDNPPPERRPDLLAAVRRSNLRLKVARRRSRPRRPGPQFEDE